MSDEYGMTDETPKKILFCGDTLGRFKYSPADFKLEFPEAAIFCNLEAALDPSQRALSDDIALGEEDVASLKSGGVSGVALENNHTNDLRTKSSLMKQLIRCDVLCANVGEVGRVEFSLGTATVCVINAYFSLPIFRYSYEGALHKKIIAELKRSKAKRKVIFLHWGYEYTSRPSPLQRKMARDYVSHGCDLVIGHHPHVVQGAEVIGESHIYYSLGNFNFPPQRSDKKNEESIGLILSYDITTGVLEEIHIGIDEDYRPFRLSGGKLKVAQCNFKQRCDSLTDDSSQWLLSDYRDWYA